MYARQTLVAITILCSFKVFPSVLWSEWRREYWDNVYADPHQRDGYEWYGPWSYYKELVAGRPFRNTDEILVVGCGTSNLSYELIKDGLSRVTSMDFSIEAIRLQRERFPDMKWVHADVCQMDCFGDRSFDVVIDKGALDSEGSQGQGAEFYRYKEMLAEVSRVLRISGRYVWITMGHPSQLDTPSYLRNATYGWTVRAVESGVQALPSDDRDGSGSEQDVQDIYVLAWRYRNSSMQNCQQYIQ
eukprot:gnl/MRDRNA2_/MRDRNA2_31941_c0_seq1.p1 gnl/MRDRNA2_/MRDRNA2_31941_c0~~gnl/MRDRNA2_/MRDRNA2_31941_c0_seq1.p1  ORF type:complete len:244 (-),score=23.79 gnl/MRDRNA2_/MRDRNA2_31941_c0_seq1:507-1238(-)